MNESYMSNIKTIPIKIKMPSGYTEWFDIDCWLDGEYVIIETIWFDKDAEIRAKIKASEIENIITQLREKLISSEGKGL